MSKCLLTPLPLSEAAIQYAWRCLAVRIGIEGGDWSRLGLRLVYGPLPEEMDRPVLWVVPAAPGSWQKLVGLMESSLEQLSAVAVMPVGQSLPGSETLPVLFWGEDVKRDKFASMVAPVVCQINVDIVSATLFMLTRWEETLSQGRDAHGRFPAQASVAWRQGFLARPIIDEYALVLQAWLKQLLPDWQPVTATFKVQLSHDIDSLRRFAPERGLWRPGGGMRTFVRTLGSGGGWESAREVWRDIGFSRSHDPADSYFKAIGKLADLATKYRLPAAFYFMTASVGPYDNGYALDSALGQLALAMVREQQHEIGLHPGYTSYDNPAELRTQVSRFVDTTKAADFGGRQHYLRFKVPDTWQHWVESGFSYDSTLGYATVAGFRAGTCHRFKPFDLAADREIDIEELPLIAMDVTFTSPAYLGLPPQQVIEEIMLLARQCQAVNGTFTLLWHNATLNAPWDAVYELILQALRKLMDEADGQ